MSIWLVPDRNNLKISDLVTYVYKECGTTFGAYEIQYQQHANQLCRYPELYPFFFEEIDGKYVGNYVEWNTFHNFIRFKINEKSRFSNNDLLRMIFNAFYQNKNIAIANSYGEIELTESQKLIDESFEEYRHRRIWEIQDILGLQHYGYGNDLAKTPTSKYYRSKEVI